MSRRSKLSLVTNKDLEKKQAAGFEVTVPDAGRVGPGEAPPSPRKGPAFESPGGAPSSTGTGRAAVAPPASRPAGRPWVKVVVVVALTALALFLLKRRIV